MLFLHLQHINTQQYNSLSKDDAPYRRGSEISSVHSHWQATQRYQYHDSPSRSRSDRLRIPKVLIAGGLLGNTPGPTGHMSGKFWLNIPPSASVSPESQVSKHQVIGCGQTFSTRAMCPESTKLPSFGKTKVGLAWKNDQPWGRPTIGVENNTLRWCYV